MKRYGALFTCLGSTAVNIEIAASVKTDSFIMKLRRVSTKKAKMTIRTDWLVWIKNTLRVSHVSGVWEQQIWSARKILSPLLKTHGTSLNDKALATLMAEVKAIMNLWTLAVELLSYENRLNSINPSDLLTMKSRIMMPPPNEFRRVVWKKEFLGTLCQPHKWYTNKRNFKKRDTAMLKDECHHRNHWPITWIFGIYPDANRSVWYAKVRIGTRLTVDYQILE